MYGEDFRYLMSSMTLCSKLRVTRVSKDGRIVPRFDSILQNFAKFHGIEPTVSETSGSETLSNPFVVEVCHATVYGFVKSLASQ